MTRFKIAPRRAAIAVALSLMFAVPLAGAAETAARGSDRVRVSVAFKPGAAAKMRAAIANAGGRVVFELEEVEAVSVDLPRRALAALKRSPYARFVEEEVMRYPYAKARSPAAGGTQVTPYGIPMVQANLVSDSMAGNRTLCIVDSGIDATHEDHQGNILAGFDYTGSSVGDWNTDESHHGTHVAGTIAAVDNTIGVIGVLPHKKLNIFISKVFDASGEASSGTVAKAMLGCRKLGSANVISMSLGGSRASRLEQAVVKFLAGRNILLIAAAGNAGDTSTSYPAGFAEVMSVAAVDSNMAHASFSQSNPDVEISGPGVGVLSTVPMGTGVDTSLTVGGVAYQANPTDGPVLSANGALYNYGTGEVSDPGVAGKMCLIQRGNISFADKVTNCMNDGGVGAVIYNNAPGNFNATLGGAPVTIPSATVSDVDGAAMLGQLGQSTALAMTPSNYAYFDGTSMATPHVSAVAALVWSKHTNCTAAQMRSSLTKSAMPLGGNVPNNDFGYGLAQAKAADDRITAMGCGN